MAAHRKRTSRKPWLLTIAFALLAGLFVVPSTANAIEFPGETNSPWLCNAAVGRTGQSAHYGEVNPQVSPCADDYFGLAGPLDLGIAQIYGYEAYTDASPYGARAYASAATITIVVGKVHITLSALQSQASAGCSWLGPYTSSSSKVVGLRINGGSARVLTGYTKINVLGLVVLELNKKTVQTTPFGGKYVTQQALVLSSSTTPGKLVIGEASAGYAYNPCSLG